MVRRAFLSSECHNGFSARLSWQKQSQNPGIVYHFNVLQAVPAFRCLQLPCKGFNHQLGLGTRNFVDFDHRDNNPIMAWHTCSDSESAQTACQLRPTNISAELRRRTPNPAVAQGNCSRCLLLDACRNEVLGGRKPASWLTTARSMSFATRPSNGWVACEPSDAIGQPSFGCA
jgi:hypothetical protein